MIFFVGILSIIIVINGKTIIIILKNSISFVAVGIYDMLC